VDVKLLSMAADRQIRILFVPANACHHH